MYENLLLPSGQDGWLGEFSGGQQDHLQWKEGEVYLLPLSEEDTGFYKAPGESERKITDILTDVWFLLGWVR